MMPITPKVVNAISMFVILLHLQSIQQMSKDQKNQCRPQPYPQGLQRKVFRYKIADNGKSHYKLAHIITILGEVVYLLFVHHDDVRKAMDVPEV